MREISNKLKISYNAVYQSLHRTTQTGSNQNRKRSGRPRCTTEQEDKYISVQVEKQTPHKSSTGSFIKQYPQNTSLNVNSEEATPGCWPSRQSSSVQCLCSFAHLNLLFLLANLRYGFFFATLSRRPASRSRLFTVDVETGVLRVLFNEAAN